MICEYVYIYIYDDSDHYHPHHEKQMIVKYHCIIQISSMTKRVSSSLSQALGDGGFQYLLAGARANVGIKVPLRIDAESTLNTKTSGG